jgi:hypothetical protein
LGFVVTLRVARSQPMMAVAYDERVRVCDLLVVFGGACLPLTATVTLKVPNQR